MFLKPITNLNLDAFVRDLSISKGAKQKRSGSQRLEMLEEEDAC
jgi:hypothetical protein